MQQRSLDHSTHPETLSLCREVDASETGVDTMSQRLEEKIKLFPIAYLPRSLFLPNETMTLEKTAGPWWSGDTY